MNSSNCRSWLTGACCVLFLAGCSPAHERRTADQETIAGASGLWDATFRLTRAPLHDSLGLSGPAREAVRGSFALIATAGQSEHALLPAPVTHAGVYDLRFDRFGFTARHSGSVHTLLAAAVSPDSLYLLLPAEESDGRLTAVGIRRGDSVSGEWQYGGRTAGGWAGTFLLTRRQEVPGKH